MESDIGTILYRIISVCKQYIIFIIFTTNNFFQGWLTRNIFQFILITFFTYPLLIRNISTNMFGIKAWRFEIISAVIKLITHKSVYTQVVDNGRFMNLFLNLYGPLFTVCSLDDDAAKNLIGCYF